MYTLTLSNKDRDLHVRIDSDRYRDRYGYPEPRHYDRYDEQADYLLIAIRFAIFAGRLISKKIKAKKAQKAQLAASNGIGEINHNVTSTWRARCKANGIDPNEPKAQINQFPEVAHKVVQLQKDLDNPNTKDMQKAKLPGKIEQVMDDELVRLAIELEDARTVNQEIHDTNVQMRLDAP